MRPLGWIVAVVAITIAGLAPARADDGLAWSAADRCGSVGELRARIEVHLGRPLVATDAIHAAVEVTRAPIEGDVRATLDIETRRGKAAREVHGANCAAVVDAVAFVLASAVSDDGAVPDRPISPTVVDDAVVPWIIRPAPAPRRERDHPHLQLGVESWSDAGTLPQLRLGLGGSLAVSVDRYRLELSGATWEDGWAPLSEQASGALGVTLRSGAVRACYGVWRLWLCAGVHHGRMRGVEGTDEIPLYAWTAVSFQTLWSRTIWGPMRLLASVEGVGNLARPEFVLDGGRIRHQPAPIAVRLGLGVAVVVW